MSSWSWLDFFIFLLFFLNTILGASRGASKEITSFLCLTVAVIFTIKFTIPITLFLNNSPLTQNVLTSQVIQNFMREMGAGPLTGVMLKELSYCIALLICFVGVFSAGEAMLHMVNFIQVISFPYAVLNKKVGGALGAIRGYVFTLILIILLAHLFRENPVENSVFVNLFKSSASVFDSLINKQDVEGYSNVFRDKNLYNDQSVYQTLGH